MRRFFSLPRLLRYDASLGRIATPQGELSLRKLFLPLFLESFLLNLMGTVNTYVLSFHADASVAAVGSANQLIGLSLTLFSVVSAGAGVVISQNLGAKEKRAASDAACFTLLFVGGFSLLLGVGLSFCGKALLRMMKLEGAFLEEAAAYFNIIIRYSFFPAMLTAFSAVFKSCGRPKVSVCHAGYERAERALELSCDLPALSHPAGRYARNCAVQRGLQVSGFSDNGHSAAACKTGAGSEPAAPA